ncbi:MAG: radical SAM family [Desulfovibrionaceae bacterium]|nr:MAG: radical SAM family [Desulfovibrionaceae bacterium]
MKKTVQHTREAYGMREEAEDFPMMVVLSFIYVCNAQCPNCPYNNSEIRTSYKDALFMPDDLFKRIADECGQYGSMLRVSGGGEPMLHPRAVELIEYAKAKGAKVGLITNGSRFTEEQLARLISIGVDAIEFSVDAADADTYAFARPGLDWVTLNRNVRMAVDLRNKLKSSTRIIVSAINQQGVDVDEVEAYWTTIADKVQIRKYLTWGYNDDRSADDSAYLPPEDRVPCPWLFERFNIDSRGFATLCGEDIAFSEKFANVYERSIKDIWHGPEFSRFRELHLTGKGEEIAICSRCPDWKYRSWQYNYWKVMRDADDKINASQDKD